MKLFLRALTVLILCCSLFTCDKSNPTDSESKIEISGKWELIQVKIEQYMDKQKNYESVGTPSQMDYPFRIWDWEKTVIHAYNWVRTDTCYHYYDIEYSISGEKLGGEFFNWTSEVEIGGVKSTVTATTAIYKNKETELLIRTTLKLANMTQYESCTYQSYSGGAPPANWPQEQCPFASR